MIVLLESAGDPDREIHVYLKYIHLVIQKNYLWLHLRKRFLTLSLPLHSGICVSLSATFVCVCVSVWKMENYNHELFSEGLQEMCLLLLVPNCNI